MAEDTIKITRQEAVIVEALGDAWNQFLKLPIEHPNDEAEFLHAIHNAQNMILARVGRRQHNLFLKAFDEVHKNV